MKALTPSQHAELIALHKVGWSYRALAKKFNISTTSVFFYNHSTPNPSEGEVPTNEGTNDLQATQQSIVGRAN